MYNVFFLNLKILLGAKIWGYGNIKRNDISKEKFQMENSVKLVNVKATILNYINISFIAHFSLDKYCFNLKTFWKQLIYLCMSQYLSFRARQRDIYIILIDKNKRICISLKTYMYLPFSNLSLWISINNYIFLRFYPKSKEFQYILSCEYKHTHACTHMIFIFTCI